MNSERLWRNITLTLMALGCIHLALVAGRDQVEEPKLDDPVPVMSAAPGEVTMSHRKFDPTGKRLLNSREGY